MKDLLHVGVYKHIPNIYFAITIVHRQTHLVSRTLTVLNVIMRTCTMEQHFFRNIHDAPPRFK